jgi:hypothetical protein
LDCIASQQKTLVAESGTTGITSQQKTLVAESGTTDTLNAWLKWQRSTMDLNGFESTIPSSHKRLQIIITPTQWYLVLEMFT